MAKKRVAIVTGASRGIGQGIALALAEREWAIVINYRSNVAAAKETAAAVEKRGGASLILEADVADPAARQHLVAATRRRLGPISLLVNNAGIGPRQRLDLLETTEESYDWVLDVNLKGPFFLTQAVARAMLEDLHNGRLTAPKIINVSSISAYTSSTNRGEYCISKAGMSMLTLLFADRLAEEGINVYEIRPGIVETDLTAGVKEKYDHLLADGLAPIRRWGQPADIGKAVVALAEGYLPYSTGEVINVDGGFHMHRL